MLIRIETQGTPGSGKTTALLLMEKALKERFNIKDRSEQLEMGGKNVLLLEVELR